MDPQIGRLADWQIFHGAPEIDWRWYYACSSLAPIFSHPPSSKGYLVCPEKRRPTQAFIPSG